MMENKIPDTPTAETPELTLYRCPVCGKVMAELIATDVNGWMRCSYNHRTTYRNGIPVQTTKNGSPIWEAS